MRINKNKVLEALKKISSFTNPAGISPILGCTVFTFTPKDNSLRLMATDLSNYYWNRSEVEYHAGYPASKAEIMIDTKIAINLLSTFTSNDIEVTINPEASTITFAAKDAELTTSYMSADDFPMWPVNADKIKTIVKTDDKDIFITALKSIKYCILKEKVPAKAMFTGIHIDITENDVYIEACDGKRAARAKYANAGNEQGSYLISSALLERLPEKTAIEIQSDETYVGFKTDTEAYFTRFIEGKFPDVKAIIPTAYKVKVEIGATKMIDHLKVIETIAKDGDYTAKFDISKNGIKFTTAAKTNKAKCEYKEAVTDGELDINFNVKFFKECLSALLNEKTELKFTAQQGPVHVKEEKDGVEYDHVLMPVRPSFKV